MTTITIPKKLAREGDLVLVPRREYERLLKQKVIPITNLTTAEKRALKHARLEFAKGDYVNLKELDYELGITPRKKR